MAVELRVLGGVEVLVDGRPVPVGHARQRCVLAALLMDLNHVLTVDQLMDRVWGERLPHRPRPVVRSYLSRLRHALPAGGLAIERRPSGYVLVGEPDSLDVHRFHRLLGAARTETDGRRALAATEAALATWRGEAFAGLDTPWINGMRDTLARERFAAETDRVDLALRQGGHATLVAELTARAAAHRLDERLAGQLMLALYRSGRPAEALSHYQRLRLRLREEQGTDPSAPLRELHQRILTADPTLTLPGTAAAGASGTPVPRQLPPPPRLFTGRTDELAALTKAMDSGAGTTTIAVIGGAGGIGKSWLALRWAYQNAERFPDGQLHVDLHGFDPTGTPTPPAAALRGLLDALGVAPAAVPVTQEAQVGLYRSLLAGRRVLVLLDNARDSAQVEPLLAGGPGGAILVTSRNQLSGLVTGHGAVPLDLDELDACGAHELLTAHLGRSRVDAEPAAVAELLGYCGGLPLAIGIVGTRAAAKPGFPLRALAEDLRDASGRLDALDAGELTANLRVVFASSHRALDDAATDLFGLLGSIPGPDIGLPALAALADRQGAELRAPLRDLVAVHLVHEHAPGRYRMHDLVRLYAAGQAPDRPAATRRLVDHYLWTAYHGERLLEPHREPITLAPPVPGARPCPPADEKAALAWFHVETPGVFTAQRLAAERRWDRAVWQLAWATTAYLSRRGRMLDRIDAWRAGLAAACRLGDAGMEALAHRLLGYAYAEAGRHEPALEHLDRALTLAEDIGDLAIQAPTRHALARAWEQHGHQRRALTNATQALRLYQALSDPAGEARAHNDVGWLHARLGQHAQAWAHCETALALFRSLHEPAGEACCLDTLGYVAHLAGEHRVALGYLRHALALYRDVGATYLTANTLDHLAHAYAAVGEEWRARGTWQRALALYADQHRLLDAARVRDQLAGHPHVDDRAAN